MSSKSRRAFVKQSFGATLASTNLAVFAGLIPADGAPRTSSTGIGTGLVLHHGTTAANPYKLICTSPEAADLSNPNGGVADPGGTIAYSPCRKLHEKFSEDWTPDPDNSNIETQFQIHAIFVSPAKDPPGTSGTTSRTGTFIAKAYLRLFRRTRTDENSAWSTPVEQSWNSTNSSWETPSGTAAPRQFPDHTREYTVTCNPSTGAITSSSPGDADAGPTEGLKTTINVVIDDADKGTITGKAVFSSTYLTSGEMSTTVKYMSTNIPQTTVPPTTVPPTTIAP